MQTWDTRTLDVEPHRPQVLHSEEEGRTIVINLPAGEELQDHQVHERAWILVVDGEVEIEADGATHERRSGPAGADGPQGAPRGAREDAMPAWC